MKVYKGIITELPPNGIFVFGSNTEGRHGLGAAKTAREKFGAKYGQPSGRQAQSYAIITKDLTKSFHPSVSRLDIEMQRINPISTSTQYIQKLVKTSMVIQVKRWPRCLVVTR